MYGAPFDRDEYHSREWATSKICQAQLTSWLAQRPLIATFPFQQQTICSKKYVHQNKSSNHCFYWVANRGQSQLRCLLKQKHRERERGKENEIEIRSIKKIVARFASHTFLAEAKGTLYVVSLSLLLISLH